MRLFLREINLFKRKSIWNQRTIFFKEYTKFHPIFFPIGCLLEIAGILALSWKEEEESDEEVKEENKEKATDAGSNSKNEVSDTKGVNNEKKETGQDKEVLVELATISNPLSKWKGKNERL